MLSKINFKEDVDSGLCSDSYQYLSGDSGMSPLKKKRVMPDSTIYNLQIWNFLDRCSLVMQDFSNVCL